MQVPVSVRAALEVLGGIVAGAGRTWFYLLYLNTVHSSRASNIESDNSQNVGLEDYNYISDGIFPHFTTPSIKITLG
jgi:hypothetical protein